MSKLKNFIKKEDLLSGMVVSFIALPLCIGIAGASLGSAVSSPAIFGIISAILGGMVVSLFSGTHVAIHGPAAGLIVVVQQGIFSLSSIGATEPNLFLGYKRFLAASLIAGVLQIFVGLLGVAKYVTVFPTNVIHGVLAGIGVIIISKQIHVALGVTPTVTKPLALYAEIPESLKQLNPEIAFIGFLSLAILIFFKLQKKPIFNKVPAPLVVVLIGSFLSGWFDLQHDHDYLFLGKKYTVGEKFLVNLPNEIISVFNFPDFSYVFHPKSLLVTFSVFMVASLESLLATNAVDQLDPLGRKSNLNKEIIANGIGNSILALIGGLPIIVEIVRSSANINYGAKSKISDFVHGLFLIFYIVFLPSYIHLIPNAALAAILVFVGFQLANPKEFLHVWHKGKEQFVFFGTTLFITVAEDLLLGVFAGLLAKVIFLLVNGISLKDFFKLSLSISTQKDKKIIEIKSPLLFTNFLFLNKEFEISSRENINRIEINLSFSDYVDHTALTNLYDVQNMFAKSGKVIEIVGLDKLTPFSKHPAAARKKAKFS